MLQLKKLLSKARRGDIINIYDIKATANGNHKLKKYYQLI